MSPNHSIQCTAANRHGTFMQPVAAALTSSVKSHIRRTATVAVLTACLALSSLSRAADPKLTGMFSNLHFGTEDITGVEMYIVFSHGNLYATVQCAEGAPGIPETVRVSVSGSSL